MGGVGGWMVDGWWMDGGWMGGVGVCMYASMVNHL